MHMLTLVLKHTDLIEELIHELAEAGLHGGTIIDCSGMASFLERFDDLPMFTMLKHIFEEDEDQETSKTLFFIVNDEELAKARAVIKDVVGALNKPNTGIMFSIPVEFVEGLGD